MCKVDVPGPTPQETFSTKGNNVVWPGAFSQQCLKLCMNPQCVYIKLKCVTNVGNVMSTFTNYFQMIQVPVASNNSRYEGFHLCDHYACVFSAFVLSRPILEEAECACEHMNHMKDCIARLAVCDLVVVLCKLTLGICSAHGWELALVGIRFLFFLFFPFLGKQVAKDTTNPGCVCAIKADVSPFKG